MPQTRSQTTSFENSSIRHDKSNDEDIIPIPIPIQIFLWRQSR